MLEIKTFVTTLRRQITIQHFFLLHWGNPIKRRPLYHIYFVTSTFVIDSKFVNEIVYDSIL
jgi:hypothetical protein